MMLIKRKPEKKHHLCDIRSRNCVDHLLFKLREHEVFLIYQELLGKKLKENLGHKENSRADPFLRLRSRIDKRVF